VRTERVSIIIPTFNRARLVARAIESVLAASEDGDEVLVVDDGSTDDTAAALAVFGDRIRRIRIANSGPGAARNHGIALARNPLVAFLDSDDEWLPEKLTLQRRLLAARPDLVFCFSDFRMRSADGRVSEHYLQYWHGIRRPWDAILGSGVAYSSLAPLPAGNADFLVHAGSLYLPLLEGPLVPAWTALVRRSHAGNALRFAEDIRICEDWECFARLARVGPAAYMASDLAVNNSHLGARLTAAHDQFQLLTARLAITERVWGVDAAFRGAHEAAYARSVRAVRLARAKWLLSRGRSREARAELRAAPGGHLLTTALATLPGPFTRALGTSRRATLAAVHAALHLIPYLESITWPDI
jgi:glycosyltransferase involved in cell wall biosynthesis